MVERKATAQKLDFEERKLQHQKTTSFSTLFSLEQEAEAVMGIDSGLELSSLWPLYQKFNFISHIKQYTNIHNVPWSEML